MKNHNTYNRLLLGFLLLFVIISATAQEINKQKNWMIDVGLSGAIQSSSEEIYQHMNSHGFNDDEWWIIGPTIEYPRYIRTSGSMHISVSRYINKNFYAGLLYSNSGFRGVQGYYDFPGFNSSAKITVKLSNNTVGPILTYVLKDRLEIQMAPVIMRNKSKSDCFEEHIHKTTDKQNIQTAPGLMAGFNLRLNQGDFLVKLFVHGLYTPTKHKVSGFSVGNGPELTSLDVNFSHLKIGVSVGFNH